MWDSLTLLEKDVDIIQLAYILNEKKTKEDILEF